MCYSTVVKSFNTGKNCLRWPSSVVVKMCNWLERFLKYKHIDSNALSCGCGRSCQLRLFDTGHVIELIIGIQPYEITEYYHCRCASSLNGRTSFLSTKHLQYLTHLLSDFQFLMRWYRVLTEHTFLEINCAASQRTVWLVIPWNSPRQICDCKYSARHMSNS